MNVIAIIQARTGSTRLPNKVFYELSGKPLLYHVVERIRHSSEIDKIVVATTKSKNDDLINNWAKENGVSCFRGSEENVLERYYYAAEKYNADLIVRITADDPFKDYRIIDNAVRIIKENNLDFVCNNNPVSFPEGLDVEVLTMNSLKKSFQDSTTKFEKEHVTQHIHLNKNKFKIFNIKNNINLSHYRWTLDTIEDYNFIKLIYDNLYIKDEIFLPEEIYKLLEKKPFLLDINKNVTKSTLY
jgi:spore coat polysaccharide biosynthesis protein SpsF